MKRRAFLKSFLAGIGALSANPITFTDIVVPSPSKNTPISFLTLYLEISLDDKGNIVHLIDRTMKVDYSPKLHPSTLLGLFKDFKYIKPLQLEYGHNKDTLLLHYPNNVTAAIKASHNNEYITFELLSLTPQNAADCVVWGPYKTTITKTIGETICVVSNQHFAFGLQALNINTIEGLPNKNGEDNAGGGYFIDPLPGQTLPESLKGKIGEQVHINVDKTGDIPPYVRLYRGSAAIKASFGSELRLFARDRKKPRIVGSGDNIQYVEPITVDFIGSKIAMFGCPQKLTLNTIREIELNENLPHPMINGAWIKQSGTVGEAYMMYDGTNWTNAIQHANACGFKLIHLGTVFKTWGHFGLKTGRFPQGAKGIRTLAALGNKSGILLGLHTLSEFITSNDSYVTPVPSLSLCKRGSSTLVSALKVDDREIEIMDPTFFRDPGLTHTVQIDEELIGYKRLSHTAPWKLEHCERGQFGTKVSFHEKSTKISKLVNNGYGGFYPDIDLQAELSTRLADVCNETHVGLMTFDGFGGSSPTGQGCYGAAQFIKNWYDNLQQHNVLVSAAGTFHYFWHIYAFMNWGEPWYNKLRNSMVNYRLENQRYFKRNLMPHMLGWFVLHPSYRPIDVEWIQARSAGFDAGYLLVIDDNVDKYGFREQAFSLIKEWQTARKANAFTPKQKVRLMDPKREFHLEKISDHRWNLFPVKLSSGCRHEYRAVQPGQPVSNSFPFVNPYYRQPLQFYMTAEGSNAKSTGTISHLELTVNSYQRCLIDVTLKTGDRIFCDGKNMWLCNQTWVKMKDLQDTKIPSIGGGRNAIEVRCDFSGSNAPDLVFNFVVMGKPELVKI